MIGPPGATSNMSDHDVGKNSVRVKRRTFEDLDIDKFCDEICHNSKKRNTVEPDSLEMALADIVHTPPSSLSSSSSSSSSSSIQFPLVTSSVEVIPSNNSNDGSGDSAAAVARLEVLVVDGSWDVTNFGDSDLIDLSTSATDEAIVKNVTNVDSIENGFNTILSYWESAAVTAIANSDEQCTNGMENSESAQSNALVIPPTIPNYQQDDHEHGNLSWLLDFKLDSLIEAPEEKSNVSCECHNQTVYKSHQQVSTRPDNSVSYSNISTANSNVDSNGETIIQREKQLNLNYGSSDSRSFSANHYNGPKKPPFTYTELIEHALQERGELTVSAIYQWISEHFPYYKSNDDRWKNSVRHNLSINPHFRKGSKAPHGAGHLWAIANKNESRPRQLIANIPGITAAIQRSAPVKSVLDNTTIRKNSPLMRQTVPIDEVEAATANISEENNKNTLTTVTLEHYAEQILSGIKREVEVQYLLPMVVEDGCDLKSNSQIDQNEQTCDEKDTERDCWNVLADFLNPVAREVVVEECGLIGESYLVTDLNPTTLGLNIVEPEVITPDHLFGEELSFQFYELASPSQLQSA